MNIIGEVAVVGGVCLLSVGISAALPFAFPASVIGMLLLLLLLSCGLLKERHISRFAAFLTGNMAFFFIPPCVGLMQHARELASCLLPFLLVSIVTTPVIYCAAAWTIQLLMSARGKKGGDRHA